jgi:hypothetical protein
VVPLAGRGEGWSGDDGGGRAWLVTTAHLVAVVGSRHGRGKEREREHARERQRGVAWCLLRQGWRGMGAGRAVPAACPGGVVIKLVTVTTCKVGPMAMCSSLKHRVASS